MVAALADFVAGASDDQFPPEARSRAVDAMTDAIGCAIAGSRESVAAAVLSVVPRHERRASSGPLLGTPWNSSHTDSALYNGTAAHALDYDDSSHPAYAHPSAVLVAAFLAFLDRPGITGADLVSAHIVGVEVFGKLGRALNQDHARFGWHPTSTFGAIAAAAAIGRLLRLSAHQVDMAVAIAASSTGGLRANFGTQTKPVHAGLAARNGVLAALLAEAGIDGRSDILSHPSGFAQTFNRGGKMELDALRRWGEELEILTEFGLALKPFPSCAALHPATEAALQLRGDLDGNCDRIKEIDAAVPNFAFESLIRKRPGTPTESRFSLEYSIAVAMLDGNVGLSSFTAERMADPALEALMQKVRVVSDERVRDDHEFASVINVVTHEGDRIERLVPLAIGKPGRWFTKQRLFEKYAECAAAAIDSERAEASFNTLQSIDSPITGKALLDMFGALSPRQEPSMKRAAGMS